MVHPAGTRDAPAGGACLVRKRACCPSILYCASRILTSRSLCASDPVALCKLATHFPPLSTVASSYNRGSTRRCDVVSTVVEGEDIVVRWRLSGRINLPFNPPIKPYIVTTTFERDSGKPALLCYVWRGELDVLKT